MKTTSQLLDTDADGISIGRTEFNCETVRPIPLAYVVVLICQQGSAEWDVNFNPYRMEKDDFFFFAEDTVACFKSRSDDFLCNYYLVSRSIAAEIADGLPTSLFIYLSRSPFFGKIGDSCRIKSLGSSRPKQFRSNAPLTSGP